jgi:hypothetical protein
MYNYCPKFLWIVKSSDDKGDILIELSYYDVLRYGMGLQFLKTENGGYTAFDLEKYVQVPDQIPVVIFPEVILTFNL